MLPNLVLALWIYKGPLKLHYEILGAYYDVQVNKVQVYMMGALNLK